MEKIGIAPCLLFYAAALYLPSQRSCGMSTRAAVLCVLFPHCCAMSTFSTQLRNFYFFPRCCDISLLSTLLRNVSTFSLLLCSVYFFHDAAPCLLIQRCCVISALTTLLCHIYFFHAAALCLLRYVYSFHTAAPCLLFPNC